jgi:hypothetical protein
MQFNGRRGVDGDVGRKENEAGVTSSEKTTLGLV